MYDSKLFFTPNEAINYAGVGLDYLYDFGRDIFFYIVRYWDAIVTVLVHCDGSVYCLQQALFVNAGDDEAGFVKSFGTLGAGADADGREWVTDGGEEGGLFG